MAKRTETAAKKKAIEQYDHKGKKRTNNPPVGLVDAKSDAVEGKKTYAYDPHLDPTLVWAGKAERTSFEIPTVSLHVHERIDPRSIIEAVRKKNGSDYEQMSLFNSKTENPPLREAIEFYKHAHNWNPSKAADACGELAPQLPKMLQVCCTCVAGFVAPLVLEHQRCSGCSTFSEFYIIITMKNFECGMQNLKKSKDRFMNPVSANSSASARERILNTKPTKDCFVNFVCFCKNHFAHAEGAEGKQYLGGGAAPTLPLN